MNLRLIKSFQAIVQTQWDHLIPPDFPFARWGFISALEASGCIGMGTGWEPCVIEAVEQGETVGALLLFKKWDSYGEFIFDWEWARAFHQAGYHYYPKLTAALPFTPVVGPKLYLHPRANRMKVSEALISFLLKLPEQEACSSLHLLYIPPTERPYYPQPPLQLRKDIQFVWTNRGFANFTDFLGSLRRKRRVQIERERRQVAQLGLEFKTISGSGVEAWHMEKMFEFYLSTHDKRGGLPYLNREFFSLLHARMGDALVLTTAWKETTLVAAAMHLQGGKVLYGRYWGCAEEYRNLHFELSYYRALDYAIEQGLERVEAGAQGYHKFLRGYDPELVESLHWIRTPQFTAPIVRFLDWERGEVERYFEELKSHSAYKTES